MRIIKFRGLDINSNKFVYGYFVRCGFRFCIVVDNPNGNGQTIYHVQPSSVAQLVGHDKDGKEVYEGDVLYRDFNGVHYEYEVRLFGDAVAENGCYITEKMFREMQVKAA